MQIARDSSPFLQDTPIRIRSLIELDLACGSNEEEHVPAEPQSVTCVHPLRVQGGVDEVVDARECGEHRAGAEPEEQLVTRVLGAPREPERGDEEENRNSDLRHDDEVVARQKTGTRRIHRGIEADRQMADEARFVGDNLTGITRVLGEFLFDILLGERDAKVGSFGVGDMHIDVFAAAKHIPCFRI